MLSAPVRVPETGRQPGRAIVSVLGASILVFTVLHNAIPATSSALKAAESRCSASARAAIPVDLPPDYRQSSAYQRCVEPATQRQGALVIAGVAAVLVLAAVLYLLHPAWKLRRERLVPFTARDSAGIADYLGTLCREAGLVRPPVFVWAPLDMARSGVAFGRSGRHYVALSGGLVVLYGLDRAAFRAVVLHELAHLRNGDVEKTSFAMAVWRSFVAIALVPMTAAGVLGGQLSLIWPMGWRVVALTALVYVTRNSVLRARERYADVRAATWDGPGSALSRVIESLPKTSRWRWQALLGLHPDPAERRGVLRDAAPYSARAHGSRSAPAAPRASRW